MTEQIDNPPGDLLTQLLTQERSCVGPVSNRSDLRVEDPCHPPGIVTAPPVPDGTVYREAASICLPRWLRMVGPAPWLGGAGACRAGSRRAASLLYKQQAAAVAIGVLAESQDDRPDAALLRECVRTSLIQWQLFLGTDGRPTHGLLRRSPLQAVTASLIIQLLNETTELQTNMLLADMERHIRWLIARPQQTPWIEAATVCALTDGALLVRDSSLLNEARRRLRLLLEQQDAEGWFPERGGADIGRLSLTVDALARVLRLNGWDELTGPLERMVRFLLSLLHPDGTIGGCYSSCGTAFLSPYGIELLAPVIPDAAALARVCRQRYQTLNAERFSAWHDDLCILLGPRIAMTATGVATPLPTPSSDVCGVRPHTYFPNAGLSVFLTDAYHAVVGGRNGGALHVTWRAGGGSLDEPGITVISPHGTRTSGRWSPSTQVRVTPSTVTSSGILRRPDNERVRRRGLMRRWIRQIGRRRAPTPGAPSGTQDDSYAAVPRRLAGGHYRREITLEDDLIRIQDTVHCRLHCHTILCRSLSGPDADRYVDRSSVNERTHEPIFIEGGKDVAVTRLYRNGELVDQRVPRNPGPV